VEQSWNILVVDDERYNIDLVRRALRPRRRYNIIAADSPTEALMILASTEVHLLIVDQKMPGMTGVELLEHAKLAGTPVPAIMATAYPDDADVRQALAVHLIIRILDKPWFSQEMLGAVDQAIVA